MQKGYDAFLNNRTQDLIPLPTGQSSISCKWVFRMKLLSLGLLDKYKSRLIALGYLQEE